MSSPLSSADDETAYFPLLVSLPEYKWGGAMLAVNPGSDDAALELTFYSLAGASLGTKSQTVSANSQAFLSFDETTLDFSLPADGFHQFVRSLAIAAAQGDLTAIQELAEAVRK